MASGSSCNRYLPSALQSIEHNLPTTPTLDDVAKVVNANSDRIQSIHTQTATLSMSGAPSLRASLAFERPRRLHVNAGTSLTGMEFDLGSNDELFWLWAKRQVPPATYFCRHEDYYGSAAAQVIPVHPDWLIEVLGTARIDPGGEHTDPKPVGKHRLEIRTAIPSGDGPPMQRLMIVDERSGWILEQHLYEQSGNRVASAIIRTQARDPASGVVVPGSIDIDWPATRTAFTLTLMKPQINRGAITNAREWELPQFPGAPLVDLANPPEDLLQGMRNPVVTPAPSGEYPQARSKSQWRAHGLSEGGNGSLPPLYGDRPKTASRPGPQVR